MSYSRAFTSFVLLCARHASRTAICCVFYSVLVHGQSDRTQAIDEIPQAAGARTPVTDETIFGADLWPSQLGYEAPEDGPGFISFSIYQGIRLFSCSLNNNDDLKLSMKFAYHGAYDFDYPEDSGPIISRLQNPLAYFELRQYASRKTVWMAAIGMAHESNGMYLDSTVKAEKFSVIQPTYDPQDYASMGWNYLLGRFFYTYNVESGDWLKSIVLGAELRWYFEQHFKGQLLEDTSFFTLQRPRHGFRDIDGTRMSCFINTEWRYLKVTAGVELTMGAISYSNMNYRSFLFGVYPTIQCARFKIPLYITYDAGYRHSIARYGEYSRTLMLGLRLDTESIITGVFESVM